MVGQLPGTTQGRGCALCMRRYGTKWKKILEDNEFKEVLAGRDRSNLAVRHARSKLVNVRDSRSASVPVRGLPGAAPRVSLLA